MTANQLRLSAALLLVGSFFLFFKFSPTISADLMAVWLAGRFLSAGHIDAVYPAVTQSFQMYPPSEWITFMVEDYDYHGPIYPFIYPPLWAKVASLFSNVNFWILSIFALMLNILIFCACIVLAIRASRPKMKAPIYILLGGCFLYFTHVGFIALTQSQPHIFVSFLLILVVERLRHNAPIVAGIALALGASIKIYPAIFAIFWIINGEKRALAAFTLAGAALGIASIAWAGWPLHVLFLQQLSLISHSVLVTGISFNLDSTIAQFLFQNSLVFVPPFDGVDKSRAYLGWYTMERPQLWNVLSLALIIASIAWLSIIYRNSSTAIRTRLVWPLAFTLIPLFLPLTWAYYFIPAVCFAPNLIDQLGRRLGGGILAISVLLIFRPIAAIHRNLQEIVGFPESTLQVAGFISFSLICIGFSIAIRRAKSAES